MSKSQFMVSIVMYSILTRYAIIAFISATLWSPKVFNISLASQASSMRSLVKLNKRKMFRILASN